MPVKPLTYFNAPQHGKDYIMGIPQYIVDHIVKIHSRPKFGRLSNEEYEITMRTVTELAKKEKLCAPTPPDRDLTV
ncbi:MAG: hypothetical protein WBQ25_09055 [Nitrososphaeraceae archaeon]